MSFSNLKGTKMNLFEWKEKNRSEARTKIKEVLREGGTVDSANSFLSEEEINQCHEEVAVEDFGEIMNDWTDLDLNETSDLEHGLMEYYDFEPNPHAEKMDLEIEIDLDIHEANLVNLGSIRDYVLAEDYSVELIEGNRAKVVFQRAGGTISKKKKCAAGMRLVGNRCVPQSGSQKSKMKQQGIKLKRAKRAMGAGAKKKAAIKARTTKKRVSSRSRNYSGT